MKWIPEHRAGSQVDTLEAEAISAAVAISLVIPARWI